MSFPYSYVLNLSVLGLDNLLTNKIGYSQGSIYCLRIAKGECDILMKLLALSEDVPTLQSMDRRAHLIGMRVDKTVDDLSQIEHP